MTVSLPGRRRRGAHVFLWFALVVGGATLSGAVAAQIGGAEWPDTDFTKRTVELSEIRSGGPPKDGIPALDAPRFESVAAAGERLDPREPVIVVRLGGEVRAYPLRILIWHEIVNDVVGGEPIAVTFCPLCNASLVFDRRVGGRTLDFGTTGRLRKSDLVMYDRQTQSWWQQLTGTGIVGELAGVALRQVPASIVAFADFAAEHPSAVVLSQETGFRRDYGANPYRGYDTIGSRPFAFPDPLDPRLPAMERVLNISAGGAHHLYPFGQLAANPVVNDTVGGVPVVVFSKRGTLSVLDAGDITRARTVLSATGFERTLDGRVLEFEHTERGIADRSTGSRWSLLGRATSGPLLGKQLAPTTGGVHFAFAWLAFRPDSRIYNP